MADSYRGSRYNGDSYHPRRSRSPRQNDMYRFGAGHRLGGSDRDTRRDYDNGYDRGEFRFRNEAKQTQWPSEPRAERNGMKNSNRTRNGPNNRGGRGGRGGRWQRGSKAANDRKILNTGMSRDVTPERLAGMINGANLFNPNDEESDEEMVEDSLGGVTSLNGSDAAKDDSEEGPSKKRARKERGDADGDEKPKWSNPDPYYALPPIIEDANTKKKDVVELIRKAKVAAEKEQEGATNAVVQNDDFISFGMDEEEEAEEAEEEDHISISSDDKLDGVSNSRGEEASASMVPFSHLTNFHPLLADTPVATGARPPPPSSNSEARRETDTWPPRSNHDAVNRPQQRDSAYKQHDGKRKYKAGELSQEWIENSYTRAVPWIKEDHSNLKSTSVWLHKEICDFYEFVKPTAHEHQIRKNLVDRIARALKQNYPEFDLHSFGSYAYGIYLPTADMDLCLVSRKFQRTGYPDFHPSQNQLRKVLKSLQQAGIPHEYGQQVIKSAKVPIIKFVDRMTGLKVDISFENMTGITALSSFNTWKSTYPQFTVLVTLIKQFLLMRDLNEVYNGGLGGFSVACLVVSMLQHSPDIQSANPPTLGALLLRFLKLYGNDFNMTSLGISVNPPKYIPKVRETF